MINRRQFLQITGAGVAGLLTGGLPSLGNTKGARAASNSEPDFIPDLDIALKATPAEVPILPGNPTGVWQYQGQVIKGDRASLINHERSYLEPIIRARTGKKVCIRFTNDIADRTIVYWHGLHVPADRDRHPRLVIPNSHMCMNSRLATGPGLTGTTPIPYICTENSFRFSNGGTSRMRLCG